MSEDSIELLRRYRIQVPKREGGMGLLFYLSAHGFSSIQFNSELMERADERNEHEYEERKEKKETQINEFRQ